MMNGHAFPRGEACPFHIDGTKTTEWIESIHSVVMVGLVGLEPMTFTMST